ncbi:MAG: COX15/CtaA family protein [Motiliproteus sp.]|nr:COX15/CtaA family protein [Motiliproteus sp.]MCW9053948.1 COX15/CtaA family protein [Motiliproteus sp.]
MPEEKIQAHLKRQLRLALGCCLLAWVVILLGAFVRLSDAGLGCPDWPGCYGQLTVPSAVDEVASANAEYPQRPLETAKAWKEMIHRYLAGTLGLLIAALAAYSWRNRQQIWQPKVLPNLLLVTVIFQALLGMWTVTLLVKPLIVTAHLFGGFATVSMLWILSLQLRRRLDRLGVGWDSPRPSGQRLWVAGGLVVLLLQIFLGGWTSTNYAAIGCTEFPTCNNQQWWPAMDFSEGFVLWRGLGIDYEYGVLEYPARTAIHMTHRIGAAITLVYLLLLGWRLLRSDQTAMMRTTAAVMLLLLAVQVGLGLTNVLAQLPLPVAVAHNGVAALLLMSLLTMVYLQSASGRAGASR